MIYSPKAAAKKTWTYFLLNLSLATTWLLVVIRHSDKWATDLGVEALLLVGVFQHGSRIFLPLSAARRTQRFSTNHKNQLRTLGRVFFLLGILCMVLAVLGVVSTYHRAQVLQLVAAIFAYLILGSLPDLIGDGDKSLSASQTSSQHIVLTGGQRLHTNHWGERML